MYIVAEFQTTGETTTIGTFTYTDKNLAEQKYHEILMYAAVSNVPIHAVSIFNEYGCISRNEFYEHPQITPVSVVVPEEPTPEPEGE